MDVVRMIKEQMCHVAENFDFELKNSRNDPLSQEQRSYELPSGEIIEVSLAQRIKSSEVMFKPALAGGQNQLLKDSEGGIAKIAMDAIELCDEDLRINLYSNIVLAGGTSLMKGFPERFESEIRRLVENGGKKEVNVTAALHRRYAAWIGGSMLASFSTFGDTTIKQAEYYDT